MRPSLRCVPKVITSTIILPPCSFIWTGPENLGAAASAWVRNCSIGVYSTPRHPRSSKLSASCVLVALWAHPVAVTWPLHGRYMAVGGCRLISKPRHPNDAWTPLVLHHTRPFHQNTRGQAGEPFSAPGFHRLRCHRFHRKPETVTWLTGGARSSTERLVSFIH